MKNVMKVLSLILGVVATLFGASFSMAAEIGVPDDKGAGVDLSGTPASGTQIRQGDLAEDEIDSFIAKFRPFMFPLDTDIRKSMKQVSVKSYEVEHYASGSAKLDCLTTSEFNSPRQKTANLYSLINSDDAQMFAKNSTVLLHGVKAGKNGDAVLYVVSNNGADTITVECLNADDGFVPTIPEGTLLSVLGNACAESEMLVAPENYQPRPKTVYLQKKIVNIVMTDHFKEIIKKVPFFEQDLRDNALYNFRRKNSRTWWVGYPTKIVRNQSANMGPEYVYTSEGIIRQIPAVYTTKSDQIEYSDLIALTKMQFTKYSVNNEAEAYCGKDFLENLLNIDFTKHKDVQFTASTVMGIDIKAFKTTFGTLNFKYDPTLDDLGYEDMCFIIDVKNSVRYVKEDEKNMKVDMKNGAGENREATRDVVIQSDAPALKGYNAIAVSLNKVIAGDANFRPTVEATQASTIPVEAPTDGMLVYLNKAQKITDKTHPEKTLTIRGGQVVTYSEADKTWSVFGGQPFGKYEEGWTIL